MIGIQVKLLVLCHCVKHGYIDDSIMFVWMIDASIWDHKLHIINSRED